MTRQQLVEFLDTQSRRVHFVGIGGCGMSGLATILLQQGHRVTGSDLSPNGETGRLRDMGAKVFTGHAAAHINSHVDLLVYTSAVNGENEEVKAATDLNIPTIRRGLLLTALMNHQNNIAVAGTHGKTTTTAMIAHVLRRSDSAPSYCVGAQVPVLGANAQIGGGKYFVAEADESDGTLIGFTPEYAVCLNIESEHLDFHKSMEKLVATFESFLTSTLRTAFYCADCSQCVDLSKNLRSPISFGFAPKADYRPLNIEHTVRGSRFIVACRGQEICTVELCIPGKQNIVNALAAFAVADQLGVPADKIAQALGEFTGARRRFERKFEGDGIVVVDDYAHHPTEIRATIAAARTLGHQRVIVAFQPHRYTRTQALQDQFAAAFTGADKLFLTNIYAAGERPIAGITGKTIADAVVLESPATVVYEPAVANLPKLLLAEAKHGDLIIVMGAGDIYQAANTLAEQLTARGPNLLNPEKSSMNIEGDLQALVAHRSSVRLNEPIARHTSLRIGGPAEYWVEPANERELTRVLHYCHVRNIPVTVVGRGTNLLVRDGGIEGVVVHLSNDEFSKIQVADERLMVCAGARLRSVVNEAKAHELGGLEFLEGIPGTLGGALRMNAGAMGKQLFDVVEWVRYVSYSGEIYDAAANSLPVTYRCCPIFTNHVALSAILRGQKTARSTIDANLRMFETKRWSSQPAKPSAGCIFKNPSTIPAGKLIEELGLKNARVGSACVSEVHGNFIVNEGGATAADVLKLIAVIRDKARHERGIELETEVMILGKESRH